MLKGQQESSLLEVAIGGSASRERYGSRILPFTAVVETDVDRSENVAEEKDDVVDVVKSVTKILPTAFLIAPLEPVAGNIKIRKAPLIIIRFFAGLESYALNTTFQKVVMLGNSLAIQLSMPSDIHVLPKRQQPRISISPQAGYRVTVQRRGSPGFDAILTDLSPGGLSFACQEKHEFLEVGDKVGITIQGPFFQGTPVSTFVSVCRVARVRDEGNLQQASQQYGVQFKMVSVSDSMTIDRLVKELGKQN